MTAAASEPRSDLPDLEDLPNLRDLVDDECLYLGHVSPVLAAVLALAPAGRLLMWSCRAVRTRRGARVLLRLGDAYFLLSHLEASREAGTLNREVVDLQTAYRFAQDVAHALAVASRIALLTRAAQ